MTEAEGWAVRFGRALTLTAALFAQVGMQAAQASSGPPASTTAATAPITTTAPAAVYSCAKTRAGSPRPGTNVVSTARFGPYQATLSGRVAPGGFVAKPYLALADDGKTVATYQLLADEPLTNFSTNGELPRSWTPATSYSGPYSDLCLARFSADQPPTGTAQSGDQPRVVALVAVNDPPDANQCCEILNLFDVEGGRGYAFANEIGAVNLGPEAPADLVPQRGTALLVTVDSAFFQQFVDEADTASPVKVLQIGPYGVEDVTRSWLGYVRADAAAWLKELSRRGEERSQYGRGILAAWAADECELGHGQAALARIAQVAASEVVDAGYGSARSFVAHLRSFLAAHGYNC
ncbi:MAG TPA: hypothetical protein VME46_08480 [Acidimicrobiales bacterium]|nr:hypothetical protein [Acidimicrobiales bacterium]